MPAVILRRVDAAAASRKAGQGIRADHLLGVAQDKVAQMNPGMGVRRPACSLPVGEVGADRLRVVAAATVKYAR